MLRLLHTADWHLGKRIGRFERLDEQRHALEVLLHHAENERVDAVLIAGDVFESANPNAEAQGLFYDILHELARGGERPVLVIAGNHDSPERLEAAARWGHRLGILLLGFPETTPPPAGTLLGKTLLRRSSPGLIELEHPRWSSPLRILPLPYASPYRIQQPLEESFFEWLRRFWHNALQARSNESIPTVVLSHLYCRAPDGTIPEEDEEEKPAALGGAEPIPPEVFPKEAHYIALGHLHRTMLLQPSSPTIAYAGSLLPYSFADPAPEKAALLVDLSSAGVRQCIPLPIHGGRPLYRLICRSVTEALHELTCHSDAYVELVIHCDHALTVEDHQRLLQAHPRLVRLIPLPRQMGGETLLSPTLQQMEQLDIVELFAAFFRSRKGTDPDPALRELFQAIVREHLTNSPA
ncbi:MAG: exonuclease subunit SbcD [Candidatus Kapabacteria bacterium]|nr:exonuclease subunit SbcD [Candidatus Kapabacteria bacterium]MCS7169347.1 exonuclease subunit SbcD [Candidatus Kapabacteria bacterium]MDW7997449.1 exonuclease subunit SbcD [Bacteroidota bacterium]MDW8224565.1 exonuclease subunit SbcD [Bacteroidota bacterium]